MNKVKEKPESDLNGCIEKNGNLNVEFSSVNENKNYDKSETEVVSYISLFRYSTTFDKCSIILGSLFAIGCGACYPFMMILFGNITGDIVNYVREINNISESGEINKTVSIDIYDCVINFSIQSSILGLISTLLTYLSGLLFSYSCVRQIFKIRSLYLEKTLNQDISWYDTHQTGEFATVLTENLSKMEEGIGDKVSIFLFYEATFVAGVIMALVKGWELALICLISLPLSSISMGFITWLTAKFAKNEMDAYASAGSIAEEVLTAIRTVVAFDGQKKESERYRYDLQFACYNNIKRNLFSGISNGILWFFIYAAYALSFWYGVGLILKESTLPPSEQVYTAGNMISVFFCTLMATWNFGMGAPYLETFSIAKGAAGKIFGVIDNIPIINSSKGNGKIPKTIEGNITFKNVHFSYPSRPDVKVLQDFNISIKSGETVALVGSSGCGKSTTIQLIQRFYDPTFGEVCLDGNNIKDMDLTWLRSNIGVVGQEPVLFATTISENIKYGNQAASQKDIERAAKKANAHNFIMSLPQGYNTIIGERGAQLSGGQKQRIAIARALVREPVILLLDEATSALDTTSEAKVQAALDAASNESTTIIVAHRLSTIRGADRIVVVSEGRVVEEGTHDDLFAAKGAYYNLVISQHGQCDSDSVSGTKSISTVASDKAAGLVKSIIEDTSPEEINITYETVLEEERQSSLWEVMKSNKPEWLEIVIGCASSILTGAALPVYAIVFGDIVGVLASNDEDYVRQETNKFCLYFFIIGVVSGLATFCQIYTFGIAGEKLTMRMRSLLFETILKQEIGWFDKKENGVGALCAKLSGEATAIQGASGPRIGTALNSAATFLLAVGFALYFEWKLALVTLSFSPLIFISIYFEQKIIQNVDQTGDKNLEKPAKIAVEAISNIRTVASLGCENTFYHLYVTDLVLYHRAAKRKSHFRSFILGLARSLMFFAYATSMYYGVKLIVEETVDYGVVFKVQEAVIVGSWSIGNALAFSPNFQKGIKAASEIFKLLNRTPQIQNAENASTQHWETGHVDYSKLYFSYPTRPTIPVLNGLDLSILEGHTVALVGSSGCGKSTIIQLLERFYDPNLGIITIDGMEIKNMDLSTLRSQLGIVSQEPNLFDRTIAENIAYGDNNRVVNGDEIIEAAKNANIHNFIASLPLGYETRVGDKGTQLSGGQKQRIAIARALVRNPRILLLDEATSALDNESEKIVQEALDNAKKGRTCITIAHRLTTIQDADVICVINEGRVTEIGKHQELLDHKGIYYSFHKLQAGHK